MIITSSAFDDGGMIPRKFTCDGGDINPELLIQNVPEEAKSLALMFYDPEAPRPGGFFHWIVWNIDPRTTVIKEESIPPGSLEGENNAGKIGYTGPCPPVGAPHEYHFYLFALDTILDLSEGASRVEIDEAVRKHTIVQAELVGLYGRA